MSDGKLLRIHTLLEYETESTVLAHDGVFVEVPPEQKPEYVLYLSTEENLRHREVYERTKQAMFKLIESIDPAEAENVGHLEFEWKRHDLTDYTSSFGDAE